VPPGHYFMVGDDRDNSLDGGAAPQIGGVGFVPVENLVGRAEFVLGSVDDPAASGLRQWPAKLRLSRVFKGVRAQR
jgi:signal peptidase I